MWWNPRLLLVFLPGWLGLAVSLAMAGPEEASKDPFQTRQERVTEIDRELAQNSKQLADWAAKLKRGGCGWTPDEYLVRERERIETLRKKGTSAKELAALTKSLEEAESEIRKFMDERSKQNVRLEDFIKLKQRTTELEAEKAALQRVVPGPKAAQAAK